jgi:hypothetical protein
MRYLVQVGYGSIKSVFGLWNPLLNKDHLLYLLHADLNELTELLTHLGRSKSSNIDEINEPEGGSVAFGGFDTIYGSQAVN